MSDDRRSIELEIEVPGRAEEVWRAVATGPGISSWYVPHTMEERAGGVATASFGPESEMQVTGRVAVWEPPHRVVFDGGEGVDGLDFEWTVEPHGDDTCIVRLVNSGFGVGSEHNKDVWRSIVRQMVAADLLSLDIGGYGGLRMTETGRGLLKGEGSFRYRNDTVKAKPAKLPRAQRAEIDLSDDDAGLLAKLKALRRDLAEERGVPAYVIFADRSLIEMAHHRPRTPLEFAKIHGVGEAKLRDLAEPFLQAIAAEGA